MLTSALAGAITRRCPPTASRQRFLATRRVARSSPADLSLNYLLAYEKRHFENHFAGIFQTLSEQGTTPRSKLVRGRIAWATLRTRRRKDRPCSTDRTPNRGHMRSGHMRRLQWSHLARRTPNRGWTAKRRRRTKRECENCPADSLPRHDLRDRKRASSGPRAPP